MSEHTYGPLNVRPVLLRAEDIEFGDRAREEYEDDGVLEASILEHGIIQSIFLQERPGQKPLLIAGGRRFRIAEKHGLDIPCLISTKPLDRLDIKTLELAENIRRKSLTPDEEVKLVQEIHQLQTEKYGARLRGTPAKDKDGNQQGWTIADTAAMLGVNTSTVSRDLQLAKAFEAIPELKNAITTKKDASKILQRMINEADLSERAEKFKQSLSDVPKKQLINAYIVGDFLEHVEGLAEGTIDFIECDPFYGIELIDLYERRAAGPIKYCREQYKDCPPAVYEWYIREVMQKCYRVAREGSWGICWFAMEPWFEPTYQAIKDAGFFVRRVPGFWIQPAGATYNANLLLASCADSFFYFRKGQTKLNKPGRSNCFLYGHVPPQRKIHPTERPVELYEDILQTFTKPNDCVLVPFAGSGNVLLACSNVGLNVIGYDLSAQFKNGFIVRVMEGEFGRYRSLKEKEKPNENN